MILKPTWIAIMVKNSELVCFSPINNSLTDSNEKKAIPELATASIEGIMNSKKIRFLFSPSE